jgi:hypothetical protein
MSLSVFCFILFLIICFGFGARIPHLVQGLLHLITAFRPAAGPTQLHTQWVQHSMFLELTNQPPSGAEVRDGGAMPLLSHTSSWPKLTFLPLLIIRIYISSFENLQITVLLSLEWRCDLCTSYLKSKAVILTSLRIRPEFLFNFVPRKLLVCSSSYTKSIIYV